jgi:hypothetical protein
VRQQYHFRQSAQGLLAWDVFRLIELAKTLPVIEVPLTAIKELDEAFWYDLGNARPTCRSIIEHVDLMGKADLRYPIILCEQGRVMDGMHRVCKAVLQGNLLIKAVQFSTAVAPDHIGINPEELPYGPDRTL